ncbi:MAG: hypothetical protein LBC81_03850 [Tannerellaceae bacterium]|jgi:hypothetical protein|nr:hypothetical protein [Tannerellaceae bacterium]
MEIISDFLNEKYPMLALIAVTGYIVYKLAMYHNPIKETKNTVVKHTDQLDHLNKTVDKYTVQLDKIIDTLNHISDLIMGKDHNGRLDERYSLAELTQAGVELLEVSGGKKCVDENIKLFPK